MARLTLEIVTPNAEIFNEEVDEVILPGTEGELGVLPEHLPLMTTLRSGRLIAVQGAERTRFAVHGGFAEILPDKVIILTDAAENAGDIDIKRARQALERAEHALKGDDAGRGQEVEGLTAAEVQARALQRARARLIVAEEDSKS